MSRGGRDILFICAPFLSFDISLYIIINWLLFSLLDVALFS